VGFSRGKNKVILNIFENVKNKLGNDNKGFSQDFGGSQL